ncbi:MAG: isocitrate lyase/PEP mutase family protein [Pseudomonadota bacterium]
METTSPEKPALKAALNNGEFVVAPGVQDMISAIVANKVGFDFVYASGYWLMASAHGIPDAGIATYTQMLERIAALVKTADGAVIADADTGYGGLLNVHHTVRGYEDAGVSAIQIEDQEFPKKCGHTPYRRVVSDEEMIEKVKVACAARRSPESTLVIARTDARQKEGLSRAIDRACAYGDAGADILFVEALENEQEMRDAVATINKPMVANMASGGYSPILSVERLKDIGYAMAIFPALSSLAAAAAVEQAFTSLKQKGDAASPGVPLFDFSEFCSRIGFKEIWAFERKWAADREE